MTARVVESVDGTTLNTLVDGVAKDGAEVYTDGAAAHKGRESQEAVAHSAGEYVR